MDSNFTTKIEIISLEECDKLSFLENKNSTSYILPASIWNTRSLKQAYQGGRYHWRQMVYKPAWTDLIFSSLHTVI